jgi:outer membrane receptor protein involved in Fe transport
VVRGVELYKSGIPQKFGGRLSSIMDVTSRDGNNKKVTGTAGIGPLTGKFTVEGPLGKNKKTTFIAGGRTTYSNWFLRFLSDPSFKNSKVDFGDLMLHLGHELSSKDRLYVSGYVSNDYFRLNSDSAYTYRNRNARVKWKHDFTDKLYGVFSAGMDQYDYSVQGRNNPKDAFDLTFGIRQWSGKADFRYAPDNRHDIDFGVQHILYNLQPGSKTPRDAQSLVTPVTIQPEQAGETSLYLGDQFKVNDKLSIQGGIRYTHYRYNGPRDLYVYREGQPRSESSVVDSVSYGGGEPHRWQDLGQIGIQHPPSVHPHDHQHNGDRADRHLEAERPVHRSTVRPTGVTGRIHPGRRQGNRTLAGGLLQNEPQLPRLQERRQTDPERDP